MRIHKTDKLFYRSFPYKATLAGDWAFAARYFKNKDIPRIQSKDLTDWGRSNRAAMRYPNEVTKLIQLLSQYDREQLRMRQEGYILNVFFKDRNILNQLQAVSSDEFVVEFWEPESDDALNYLLTNQRIEVKKALTHGCRYKVVLKGDAAKISNQSRINFINLCDRNPIQFRLTESMKIAIRSKPKYFWGTSYFYVKEEKFLLMAQMILQPIIKEVVKIVTYDEVKQEEALNGK